MKSIQIDVRIDSIESIRIALDSRNIERNNDANAEECLMKDLQTKRKFLIQ